MPAIIYFPTMSKSDYVQLIQERIRNDGLAAAECFVLQEMHKWLKTLTEETNEFPCLTDLKMFRGKYNEPFYFKSLQLSLREVMQ